MLVVLGIELLLMFSVFIWFRCYYLYNDFFEDIWFMIVGV